MPGISGSLSSEGDEPIEEMDKICDLGSGVLLILFVVGVDGRNLATQARCSKEILRLVVLEDEDLDGGPDTAE